VRAVAGGVAGALLILGLTSCQRDDGTGYVEIKAVPASAAVPLYLDAVKLEPLRNGNALLRRKPGTTRLETGPEAGKLSLLCNIEVRKNRITSVTVSMTGVAARCQCGRTSGAQTPADRTCIG
jgi:hypothetical protein